MNTIEAYPQCRGCTGGVDCPYCHGTGHLWPEQAGVAEAGLPPRPLFRRHRPPQRKMSLIAKVDGTWVYAAGKHGGQEVMPEEPSADLEDYFVWAVGAGAIPAWQRAENEELDAFYDYAKAECDRRCRERGHTPYHERGWWQAGGGSGDAHVNMQMAVVKRHWPFADLDKGNSTKMLAIEKTGGMNVDYDDFPLGGEGGVMWGDRPDIW